jgi:hypothetical protein
MAREIRRWVTTPSTPIFDVSLDGCLVAQSAHG